MVINQPGTTSLIGVFDLETKAFVAAAQIGGTSATWPRSAPPTTPTTTSCSSGSATGSAAQGIDLPTLLATKVIVAQRVANETSLSLLNGLQIDPSTKHGGIHLSSAATVQAGVLLDIYSSLRSAEQLPALSQSVRRVAAWTASRAARSTATR